MIASRNLLDLNSIVRLLCEKHIKLCHDRGIELLVICTYRDIEAQNELYAHGRTKPGPILTRAKGDESFHTWRLAYDGVPLVYGKPLWKVFNSDGKMNSTWLLVAASAKEVGLEWAGDWKGFKEYDHFQYTNGLTIAQLRAGITLTGENHE
jgi:peptidoglycan L-alanyl-D-glutamate endopeptidase CwlK